MLRRWLTQVTMYRLVYLVLITYALVTIVASFLSLLPYLPLDLILGALVLVGASLGSNILFARLVGVAPNTESPFITGLILFLITGPVPITVQPLRNTLVLVTLAVIAMAAKYVLIWRKQHVFNPAALAVLSAGLLFGVGSSWWIGTSTLFPIVLVGGALVVTKIRRWPMVLAFLVTYLLLVGLYRLSTGSDVLSVLVQWQTLLTATPLLFFASIMLIEPLTSPTSARGRLLFGIGTGLVLFTFHAFVPTYAYALETSLLIANAASILVFRDVRRTLTLTRVQDMADGVKGFAFTPSVPLAFRAGQYVEWTLPHPHPDSRGVRRYFTIASSPTSGELLLVAKFPEKPSSFKRALLNLKPGQTVQVAHLAGEFTLPTDTRAPLLFIAGGIGVTPFASMVQWLVDHREKRDIVLLYAARSESEIAFQDLFAEAEKTVGLRTHYVTGSDPLTVERIAEFVSDYKDRSIYISGPELMVQALTNAVKKSGAVAVRRDFFPGYLD